MSEYKDIPMKSNEIVKMLLEKFSSSKLDEIEKKIKKAKKSEWKTIHIVLDLEPKATPRPRYSGRTGVFYVKGAHSNKIFFKKYISDKDLPFITGALKVDCRCYIKTPSALSKIVLILDDAHIIEGKCSKYYSLHPRIEMDIEYQLEPDSKYNERKINIYERK